MSNNKKNTNLKASKSSHHVGSIEDVIGAVSKAKSLVDMRSVIFHSAKFLNKIGNDDRADITNLLHKKLELILRNQITTNDERDALPGVCGALGVLADVNYDNEFDTANIFKKMEHYIGRFVNILDEEKTNRVLLGFSKNNPYDASAFLKKIEERYLQLIDEGAVTEIGMKKVMHGFAEAKYQPSKEFFDKWDIQAEKMKYSIDSGNYENEILKTSDISQVLYSLSLMKAEGVDVPKELVNKWFDYAANTRDGSFRNDDWHRMYLTAKSFNINNSDRFRMSAMNETKSDSKTQKSYRAYLERAAKDRVDKSHSGLSIEIEREQLLDIIDSKVDYKVAISGGAAGSNAQTVFWVQNDGPYHFCFANGVREHSGNTKLQNMIVDKHIATDERFLRVDYQDVQESGMYKHANELVDGMIEEHINRSLKRDGLSKKVAGWQANL